MNGREWKPGDVAMVRVNNLPERQMVRYDTGDERGWYAGCGSAFTDGKSHYSEDYPHRTIHVRPIVVIDPEDIPDVNVGGSLIGSLLGAAAEIVKEAYPDREIQETTLLTHLADLFDKATEPPKPEALEHLAATLRDGLAASLCGKVWRPKRDAVTVTGKCPECVKRSGKSGWVA